MNGFGVLLALAGVVIDLLAFGASSSRWVRMALPLSVSSSPVVLHIIGLVCGVIGVSMIFLNNS